MLLNLQEVSCLALPDLPQVQPGRGISDAALFALAYAEFFLAEAPPPGVAVGSVVAKQAPDGTVVKGGCCIQVNSGQRWGVAYK